MRRLRREVLITIIAVALWPCLAAAEEQSDAVRASQLIDLGIEAAGRGDLEGAVQAMTESYALLPRPQTLYNLAHCQDQLGRLSEAYYLWLELLERFGGQILEETRQMAQGRIQVLEAALARVLVITEPPGATLSIDGEDQGTTPLGGFLRLNPGLHRFEARLEGHRTTSEVRGIQAGSEIEITMTLPIDPNAVIDQEPPDGPTRTEADEHGQESSDELQRSALDSHPDCERCPEPPEPCPEAPCPEESSSRGFWRSPWTWFVVGLVIGGGVAVGATLGATADDGFDNNVWLP